MSRSALSLLILAVPLLADDKTILSLRTLRASDGAPIAGGDVTEWTEQNQRGTQARFYTSGAQPYVIKYNGHQGRVRIYRVSANNELGAPVTHYIHSKLRGGSIDVAGTFPTPSLFVHDSFTGTIRRFRLESDGAVDFDNIIEAQHANWRDKNLFQVFSRGNTWSLFALDTFTGRVTVGNINGQPTATADWTSGYNTIDHLAVGDRTYRLLYKAAGNPYLRPGEQGDDQGRVVIQLVGANGLSEDETQRLLIPAGFTHLRFVVRPRPGQSTQYSILAFNRKTRSVNLFPFLVPQGLGVFLSVFDGTFPSTTSEVEPYVLGNEPRVMLLADDNVQPFAPAEVESMALDVHEALQDKTVGYQFMVSQSGRIIYSRAWGISKRGNPDTAMTVRTRYDLGSVTKMITTTTAMKLAEEGTGGFGLNSRASLFLPGAPANSWTHDRNVVDFLRHTTGVDEEGANECTRTEGYRMDCAPFYAAEPNVLCRAQGCARAYNNSNTVAVRKMIEAVTGASTSPELVEETYKLWARRANLDFDDGSTPENNAFGCRLPKQSLYYGRCSNGSASCFLRNGLYWHEAALFADPAQDWSINCSAGSWQASSRQMIEFLNGIRYGKFLNETSTARLVSTSERDGYGDATAIGWDPSWNAGESRQLGKNGYNPTGAVATRAYITRLPDNADAVLLINTTTPSVDSVVNVAYRRAKAETPADREPAPVYVHVVSTSAENTPDMAGVDRVAAGTLANAEPAGVTFNMGHVVAGRDSADRMKLTVWRVDERGGVEAFGSGYLPGTVENLSVSDGDAFATAVQDAQDRLRVDAWTVNPGNLNQLERQGSAFGPMIRRVAIAKVAGTGLARGRVVTAVRHQDNRFQLQAWDFDNQSNGVVGRGLHTGGEVREVAIRTLDYGAVWSSDSRLVTAVQTMDGHLTVEAWDVSGAGVIERVGVDETGVAVTGVATVRNRIAIGRLSNSRFYVAFLTGGNMKLFSYRVNAAGALTREAEYTTEKPRSEVAASGATTLARNEDGDLEVIRWEFLGSGIQVKGTETIGAVAEIAATGNVLGVYTYGDTNLLRVRNWHVVE